VNVQSVAWITQRKNLLAMLGYLVAIDCFLRAEEGRRGAYGLSLLAFLLALLSKGSVAVLPVVLLGVIAYRLRFGPRYVARLAPFFVLAAILAGVDIWFQGHHLGVAETIRQAGPVERLLGAGAVVWFYLFKAVVPLHLVFLYPAWRIAPGELRWWLPLLAAAALPVLLWFRGWRGALYAWGYYCVALLPVMGFTDVYFMKFSLVADHYQHLALIGVTAAAGAAWAEWRRRVPGALPLAAAGLAAGVLAVLTWRQCGRYRDAETLFTVTLQENPGSAMAHNNLGVILAGAHRLPEATAQFGEALRLDPGYADAERNLGLTLAREGRTAEAIPHYEAALRLQPVFADAEDDLGNALLREDRNAEALLHFERAIRLSAGDAEAQANLAIALVRLDRLPEAIAHYEEAVRLEPDNASLQVNLASALMLAARPQEAIPHFEAAVRLRPDDADARSGLAAARAAR